jgi:hypothetical protein
MCVVRRVANCVSFSLCIYWHVHDSHVRHFPIPTANRLVVTGSGPIHTACLDWKTCADDTRALRPLLWFIFCSRDEAQALCGAGGGNSCSGGGFIVN